MDIKSKRFRRSAVSKTAAFISVCALVCVAVGQLCMVSTIAFRQDLGFNMESMLNAEYTDTNIFGREAQNIVYRLLEAAENREMSDNTAEYIDVRAAYYVTDNRGFAASNTDARSLADFEDISDYCFSFENGEFTGTHPAVGYMPYGWDLNGVTMRMAFYPGYVESRQFTWAGMRSRATPLAISAACCLIAAILLISYLCFVTGRLAGSDEIHLSTIDRIYSDINLAAIAGGILGWWAAVSEMVYGYLRGWQTQNVITSSVLISAIFCPVILGLWLSLMRKVKARRLMRHSLLFVLARVLWRFITAIAGGIISFFHELFSGKRFRKYPFARALFRRQMTFIVLSALIVALFGTSLITWAHGSAFLTVVLEIVLVYFYVRANNKTFEEIELISNQVYEIFQGNMNYNPHIKPGSQLHATSMQLLDIGAGMDKALERQLASERMKISLVTNVSHDLKTPLTSIIGYIDLLSRDEGLSPEARDYVNILAAKSERLKSIIEDLFDLAKTTSGDDQSLNMEVLDLKKLVEQTLADMDDKIERSGQSVRVSVTDSPVHIRGDGRKLYRVIQNVMDNALKYSMPGTRIFVNMSANQSHARIIFKNTASYEMNFTEEEILERFVRGDKARTSDGSGLGLSIAQGFTRACGGELKLGLDGDQFKVELTFDIARPEEESEAEPAPPADEKAAPGFQQRMEALRGKLYKPDIASPAATLARPVEDGHFEPEKPVEIKELESALESLGHFDGMEDDPDTPGDDGAINRDEKVSR